MSGSVQAVQLIANLLKTPEFAAAVGMIGKGFGVTTDNNGRATLQTDDLLVLGRMIVNTLNIREGELSAVLPADRFYGRKLSLFIRHHRRTGAPEGQRYTCRLPPVVGGRRWYNRHHELFPGNRATKHFVRPSICTGNRRLTLVATGVG